MADEIKKTEKADKAAKVAKKSDKNGDKKPNFFARAAKTITRFFKDLKGEVKKIVWTDRKTVIKSTGVVLAAVLIIGAGIWVVDYGLSEILKLIKDLKPEDAKAMITAAGSVIGLF